MVSCCFQVTDVRLDGAYQQRPWTIRRLCCPRQAALVNLTESADLDGITQRRTRAVSFDVIERFRRETGTRQRFADK